MSGSQPQGQRSGEGTSGIWNHIHDDDMRKEKEPERRSNDDSRPQQHTREGEQQQSQNQR
jgi:hypothetical protein